MNLYNIDNVFVCPKYISTELSASDLEKGLIGSEDEADVKDEEDHTKKG